MTEHDDAFKALHEHAYQAMERGALAQASSDFDALLRTEPANRYYHYMRGLVAKYQFDWETSLRRNLRAIELSDDSSEGEHWNAAIAATALGKWTEARRLWTSVGIRLPDGEGPIEGNFGVAVVRLSPWQGGETVFVRRIDPARARLLNVPLPESGHRFGDIVLHDGAATGHRFDGEHEVPVFNELVRLKPSEFQTFVVFVSCDSRESLQALLDATGPGIGYSEDWTHSVRQICLRCSYGTAHTHDREESTDWQSDRNLGIAAQSRKSVDKLLGAWLAAGKDRAVAGIEVREVAVPSREDCHAWWEEPAPKGDERN